MESSGRADSKTVPDFDNQPRFVGDIEQNKISVFYEKYCMYWFQPNHSRSRFVLGLNFGHFIRDCVRKLAAQLYNLLNSIKPSSRRIYGEPIHTLERAGSKVLFDTKTFTCVYVNLCSIGIRIKPILGKNYSTTNIENCKECHWL